MSKLILPITMTKVVELFAGGGGVAAGVKMFDPTAQVWAVESDPSKPKLSTQIADNYQKNFPDHILHRKTVQQCHNASWQAFPQEPDLLWASTVCCNFSSAKNNKSETATDYEIAIATMGAVVKLRPKYFVLENVQGYAKSEVFKSVVLHTLIHYGYKFEFSTCRVSSIQGRWRLILRAYRDRTPEDEEVNLEPDKFSWWERIKTINGKETAIGPIDVECVGWKFRIGRASKRVITDQDCFPTIIRSYFTDGKGANRNNFADIFIKGCEPIGATMEMVKALCEFPEWYKLSGITSVDGSIFGNAVPPVYVKKLCEEIFKN